MKKKFLVKMQNAYGKSFTVHTPASLDAPHNNAVMFVNKKNIQKTDVLSSVSECVIFVPKTASISKEASNRNLICYCDNPRLEYCLFFRKHGITNYPQKEKLQMVNGAMIAETATIGHNTTIMPGAYIGGEVTIGDDCYIGAGVRLVGRVTVGNHVIIRENSVIGADGLSTDRDEEGRAATMPQFGGVEIQDDVQIGALTVIARGAIDDTVIGRGTKIDNSCFVSHNVHIGRDTFVVGESIMFGGSSTGDRAFISGNSTVRNKTSIGTEAFVGMGSVVVNNVPDGATVMGNPAKERKQK